MKYFLLVFILLAGCKITPYVESGVGYELNGSKVDFGNGINTSSEYKVMCYAALGADIDNLVMEIRHDSRCLIGAPFNNLDEYTNDAVFVGYRYEF